MMCRCSAALVLCLLAGEWCTPLAAEPTRPENPYLADLVALFAELDEHYPFFELKGLEKEWKARKRQLAGRANKCRTDEDFAPILIDVMKGLRDGHCRIEEMKPAYPKSNLAWPGVALLPATKDRVVVMSTAGNLSSQLPPGTIITKIDGKPAHAALELRTRRTWLTGGFFSSPQRARFFEYRMAFVGERGSQTTIHYLDGRKQKKVTLVANREARGWDHNYHLPSDLARGGDAVWYGLLEGGIGYIYLRKMDGSVVGGITAALAAHGEAKGWIVDLRGNSGGGYSDSLARTCAGLGKKVAVIVDAGAISAAETFARDLAEDNRAKLFGATTAGSSSTKKTFTLPSGIATVRYSDRSRRGLRGKAIEFLGIEPHFPVEADPAEVRAGKNSELERAREWLLKN
jgi:hypothetical protein